MQNNEILMRIRDAASLDDAHLVEIFALGGESVDEDTARAMLNSPSESHSVFCEDERLLSFLEGFIIDQRGQPKTPRDAEARTEPLSHNLVLKKLRVALNLKEDDVLRILDLGGTTMSRRQLGALARGRTNKRYRECSDEVLESFLTGLQTSN